MTLAGELRSWREAQGWSRAKAADYFGVNARTLEGWEQGRRTPPALNALRKLMALPVGNALKPRP